MADPTRIRRQAVEQHDRNTGFFIEEYRNLEKDYCASAFAYGRRQIDGLLDQHLAELPQAARILDIGCGIGEQLSRCAALGFHVAGLEPAGNMRRIARQKNPGVDIRDGVITELPFEDNSADMVIALEVLRYLHWEDIRTGLKEMLRVTHPGGIIFFTMVNRFSLDGFYLFDKLMALKGRLTGHSSRVHCTFTYPGQMRRELSKLGGKDVHCYARMFAPLRIAYKLSPAWGKYLARRIEPLDNRWSDQTWNRPLAGHLIVTARK